MSEAPPSADTADGPDGVAHPPRWDAVLARAAITYHDSAEAVRVRVGPGALPGAGSAPDAEALLLVAARDRAADGSDGHVTAETLLADALALAVVAARDRARRVADAERRVRWAVAAASAVDGVLGGHGLRPLDHVTIQAAHAADADYGSLTLVIGPGLLGVRAVSGDLGDALVGTYPDLARSLAGGVVDSGRPVLADRYPEARAAGPVAAVPVERGGAVIGVLAVGRVARGAPFTTGELGELAAFAARTAAVVDCARSGAHRQARAERDDETAAELADHVVGDLFAVGLGLQGMIAAATSPPQRERLTRYVDSITESTTRVRDFFSAELAARTHPVPLSLRLLSAVDAGELETGLPVRMSLTGNVNQAVSAPVADGVVAVVRDAITTVCHARSVEVTVECRDGGFTVVVLDDGIATLGRSRLLSRLRERAGHRSAARQELAEGGRNRLTWTVHPP